MPNPVLIAAALILTAGAANTERPQSVVGDWLSEPLPGVSTIDRLTFTADGRLITGTNQLLGRYTATGGKVVARSGHVAYVYELTDDGRLCVSPGPTLQPLAEGASAALAKGQCYRKDGPG